MIKKVRASATSLLSAVLIAGAGTVGFATPADAAVTAVSCQTPKVFWGTGRVNHGASIQCSGGVFRIKILCYKPSIDYWYTHYGPWTSSGGTSVAWCDTQATVQAITYEY
ncbi:hypothetical protein [Streptomyces sp. NPDC004285]